jgi:hypothetical protein
VLVERCPEHIRSRNKSSSQEEIMTGASEADRTEVKALLAKASIELYNTLQRVDTMGDFELADARGRVGGVVAFFDFNGSCAGTNLGATFDAALLRLRPTSSAFFDFNGSCGGISSTTGIRQTASVNEIQRLVQGALGEPGQ